MSTVQHNDGLPLVTHEDLNWWLNLAPTLDWTFATTYADSAPHHYVVEGRTPGISHEDMVRAARVIRTFGEPAKFHRSTNISLTSPDGETKWWGMESDVSRTTLINRADAHHIYGPQNAPRTAGTYSHPRGTGFDPLASSWDARNPLSPGVGVLLSRLQVTITNTRSPRTLDVGCGTGIALDAAVTEPARYVGVDPSSAMLNELVVKHPHTAGVHAMTLEDAVTQRIFGGTRFDSVLALRGSASYLSASEISAISNLSCGTAVLMHYREQDLGQQVDLDPAQAAASLEATLALVDAHGGTHRELDGYLLSVVEIG